MKLLRICSAGLYTTQYEEYIASLPDGGTYEQAIDSLREFGLLYPSRFCAELKRQGIDAQDIIADLPILQIIWSAQYSSSPIPLDLAEIFYQQISYYRPTILYFQELDSISQAMRLSLKTRFPFIKIITGFKGFPPRVFADYRDLDHLFISYPYWKNSWEKNGVSTTILPHCFDPGTKPLVEAIPKKFTFTFLGSTGYGNNAQQGRYNDLAYVLAKTDLEIWGREPRPRIVYETVKGSALGTVSLLPHTLLSLINRRKFKAEKIRSFWRDAKLVKQGSLKAIPWYVNQLPLSARYPERIHPPLAGRGYLDVLAASQVSLNRHTDEPGEGGNIRTFEVTGAASCLLTDARPNLDQLFTTDEIVTYTSPAECVAKATYLVSHPEESAAFARKAHARVMREHTCAHRVNTIVATLHDIFPQYL